VDSFVGVLSWHKIVSVSRILGIRQTWYFTLKIVCTDAVICKLQYFVIVLFSQSPVFSFPELFPLDIPGYSWIFLDIPKKIK